NHPDEDGVAEDLSEIVTAAGLLGSHLALIAARVEIERRIGARTSELALFYETSRALALAKTADDVSSVLAEHLTGALDLRTNALLILRPERGELFVETAGSASITSLRRLRRAILDEVEAIQGERPRRLTVRLRQRSPEPAAGGRNGSGEPVHVRLSAHGRMIGLLSVQPDGRMLDESQMRSLYTIASQAALTLDRVRVVETEG